MKSGERTMAGDGQVWNQIIIPTRTVLARTKSTSGTSTPAIGRSSRGKYTFVTRGTLGTTDALAVFSDAEKYCQASTPEKAKTGYGRLPDGNFAKRPKTRVYTSAVKTGW